MKSIYVFLAMVLPFIIAVKVHDYKRNKRLNEAFLRILNSTELQREIIGDELFNKLKTLK